MLLNSSFEYGENNYPDNCNQMDRCDNLNTIRYACPGDGLQPNPTADWLNDNIGNTCDSIDINPSFNGVNCLGLSLGEGASQEIEELNIGDKVRVSFAIKNYGVNLTDKNVKIFLAKNNPEFEGCNFNQDSSRLRDGLTQKLVFFNDLNISSNIINWQIYVTDYITITNKNLDWFGLFVEGDWGHQFDNHLLIDDVRLLIDECDIECCPGTVIYDGENYLPQTTVASDYIYVNDGVVRAGEEVYLSANDVNLGVEFVVEDGAEFELNNLGCINNHYGQIGVTINENCEYELCFMFAVLIFHTM